MKKVLSLTAIVLATFVPSTPARTQTNDGHASPTSDKSKTVAPSKSDTADDASKKSEAKSDPKKNAKADKKKKREPKKADPKKTAEASSTASVAPINEPDVHAATTDAPAKTAPTSVPVASSSPASSTPPKAATSNTSPSPAMTSIYRVGIGDVLDIRLLNATTNESTLFTVLPGGLLEYPLAGDPVAVAGLTTEEINAQLLPKIKLYDDPRLTVSVREYASHHVIVTGLVNDPGTKVLRREAVPLYVVLTEAQPRPEAVRATILRQGSQSIVVDLADQTSNSVLIVSGDVIRLIGAPPPQPKFLYVGGQVNVPGQKDFHEGLTLMQAVLAAGGRSRFAGGDVKVMRQGADGRLVTTKYNLKKIEEGKIPDPVLQAGDRIEVTRGGW